MSGHSGLAGRRLPSPCRLGYDDVGGMRESAEQSGWGYCCFACRSCLAVDYASSRGRRISHWVDHRLPIVPTYVAKGASRVFPFVGGGGHVVCYKSRSFATQNAIYADTGWNYIPDSGVITICCWEDLRVTVGCILESK